VGFLAPAITSSTSVTGQQGHPLNYTLTGVGTPPVTFGATGLPTGLSVNAASGAFTGIPLVSGVFDITIFATNAASTTASTNLILTLADDIPVVTSSASASGKQGVSFSYTITATNDPSTFSALSLPAGLSLNPSTGVISGIPLVNGSIPVTLGAVNEFGTGSKTLTLNLASGAPSITSPLTAFGQEQGGFLYTIKANNSPSNFWALDLPMGLAVDSNSGAITGTPIYAGNYNVPIFAANQWGVGTATLQLNINNLQVGSLFITTNLMTNYFSPYVLEFTFSMLDSSNLLTAHAVVASPSLMRVTAFEDNVPLDPSESGVYLRRASSKVVKGYLVLDFTESVATLANGDTNHNGISDAVDTEVAAAQSFVGEQPAGSQIGVYEFHRDDEAPQLVAPLTADKASLSNAIAGIWTNFVQGFPAGSRAWDAADAAVLALGAPNTDENHYVVLMSDGVDDSSTATLGTVIFDATNNNNVQVFTVGFGDQLQPFTLQSLSDATLGSFHQATDLSSLALSFAVIGKDLSSQYVLRWATLNRSANLFTPSFQITYQGITVMSPPNPQPFVSGTNFVTVTNMTTGDITTNTVLLFTTNYIMQPCLPTAIAGNVLAGSLRLVPNAATNPTAIDLRVTYAPRYIEQLHLHYRANWPVTVTLDNTNAGRILAGWTMTQADDGAGGQWLTLNSPNSSQLSNSIPFADFGKLLTFSFHDPITASNAFSEFDVDNTIYTNTSGTNFYGFMLANAAGFITSNAPPLPHGTPIPWLESHGFTNNFAAAELINTNGNGLAVWQDYLAGLNPLDPNATFTVQATGGQNPPQITFNTVVGRTYRIEWSLGLNGPWTLLRDGFVGTGGDITFTDYRDLSAVGNMFYRVGADGPGVDGP